MTDDPRGRYHLHECGCHPARPTLPSHHRQQLGFDCEHAVSRQPIRTRVSSELQVRNLHREGLYGRPKETKKIEYK